ncbi:MAG TPA: hypothetical protein VMD99_15820 [Terriglobales bacterium]|nr:hypothetical protein [Terriglobales bacterium]
MGKLRTLTVFVLFASAGACEAFRLSSLSAISNSDVWWHLSSGLWILQSHALPHTGLFSQSSGFPWIASSWAYDLLLALGYKWFGLRSLPLLLMCLRTALALLTFLLAGGLRGRFWPAVALSAVAQFVLGSGQPGPAYFSILCFGIELLLLFESRRKGSVRPLWWLPPLFLLWANLEVQFVVGIALLLLFLVALAVQRYVERTTEPMPTSAAANFLALNRVGMIAGLSLLATLITPYFYRPYGVYFSRTFNSANQYLIDFHAPGFRQPQDYILLLLAMSAFLALGLRRSRDLFQIALLSGSIVLSFYSQRDEWMITLAALAVIGEAIPSGSATESPEAVELKSKREVLLALSGTLLVLIFVFVLRVPRNREILLAKASQSYPVAACDYIRDHRLPQPLFNAYQWGGFLTWYLPDYPVAIDGRTDLYGADVITNYSKAMNAEIPYTAYPAMAGAQTILLPKSAIMAGALGSLPIFKKVYDDDLAIVLVRSNPQ